MRPRISMGAAPESDHSPLIDSRDFEKERKWGSHRSCLFGEVWMGAWAVMMPPAAIYILTSNPTGPANIIISSLMFVGMFMLVLSFIDEGRKRVGTLRLQVFREGIRMYMRKPVLRKQTFAHRSDMRSIIFIHRERHPAPYAFVLETINGKRHYSGRRPKREMEAYVSTFERLWPDICKHVTEGES